MSDPRVFVCGGLPLSAAGKKDKSTAPPTALRIGDGKRDAHLEISSLSAVLQSRMSDVAADLLELATYVYVADQMATRGGTREFEYGERWKRRLRFHVPVRRPDVWNRPDVASALRELLEFLADDHYDFRFVRNPRPADPGSYLTDSLSEPAGGDFEDVALFSGGVDSLAGAVDEVLIAQRRMVLVSHRPVNRMYARQRDLVGELRKRLARPDRRPLHVAIEVNKGKPLAHSFTQRSRSFLFASFAAVVARGIGLSRFRFYENGVTSFNLPLNGELLGARASRTTHPRAIAGFGKLFSLLFDAPFEVENPYLWSTKAEVFGRLRTAGHADLCAMTCSCIHTWDRTTQHTHCGLCSQCVDRRLSAIASDTSERHDEPARYQTDVILGRREHAELTYAERYTGFALDMERIATPAEFVQRYPQITWALQHLGLPTLGGLERIYQLHRRHAEGIRAALDSITRANSGLILRQAFPAQSLLGVVLGRRSPTVELAALGDREPPLASPSQPVADRNRFEVRFGNRGCELGNTKEFLLFERLLKARGNYLSVDTLRGDVWGDPHVEKHSIHRVVYNLRRKLKESGIVEIVLDGKQRDHYRLVVARMPAKA